MVVSVVGILVAAVATFVVGGLWYSVLFARVWQRAAGVTDEQVRSGTARVFGGAFVLALVMATALAAFIGAAGAAFGAFAGAAAGVCWVAAALGVSYLFERRPLTLLWVNGGYNAVTFTLMGAILGAFQA